MTTLTVQAVEVALGNLLKGGLPARLHDPLGGLLELRAVIARSVKPEDPLSRLEAFNNLLKRLIRRWPREAERQALAAMYGLEKGYAGRTLTVRRERAAEHLHYDSTHFRKEIEKRLVTDLASAVWQDHLRYSPRTKYAPPPIEASGDTPVLGPGDYTDQDELVSRIWSEVYALRAEIIAGGRVKKDQTRHNELPEARGRILWRTARLLTYVEQYLQTYGDRILQGGTEWDIEGLIRLAGWRGGVSQEQIMRLRLSIAQAGLDDLRTFTLRLRMTPDKSSRLPTTQAA